MGMPLNQSKSSPGWWFGTFLIFPYIGNNHPADELVFFRGAGQPPTSPFIDGFS